MLEKPQINHPANFVTPTAVGYADSLGGFTLVTADAPLPVTLEARPEPPAPLEGTADNPTTAGPFMPAANTPIHLQLTGEWTGTVALLRSVDDGVTRVPVTAGGQPWAVFTANANEAVWQEAEAGACFYLDLSITSGTVTYRVSQ